VFAEKRYERLRAITNFFIVSLAFADLLVASLVMPFNASKELMGDRWVFGRSMCDIFNANDVLFSTASIIHLCCISLDRYLAILHPLTYETRMTSSRALMMLGVTWVASVLISYIPVYTQMYTTEEYLQRMRDDPERCEFQVNRVYAGVSSSVSFWIPCVIMIFVYARIYIEARKQEKLIQSSVVYLHYGEARSYNGVARDVPEVQRYERRKMRREHKAAKTLGVIMGTFIVCYLPFFTWYVTTTMCATCPSPPTLGKALFWVGYFNSCLNPIIYAFFNRDFRSAFKKILRINGNSQSGFPFDNNSDPTQRALNTSFANNNASSSHRDSVRTSHRDSVNTTHRDSVNTNHRGSCNMAVRSSLCSADAGNNRRVSL